jgi:AcrR family transcriptional regulator
MARVNEPSVTETRSTPASEAPPNAQRERIRLAAVQFFTRQGFAGTSMKELARAIEMAPGNLYNYYPNKEAILLDVLEHQLLAMVGRDRQILARDESPADTLSALTRDLVVHDLNDPLAAFVGIQGVRGLSEENLAYISRLMGDIRASWIAVIAEGAASGAFAVRDPKLCALSVLTLCSSVSSWYQPGGEYSAEYVAEGVAEMALRMAGSATS